jgi:hypothetical protein
MAPSRVVLVAVILILAGVGVAEATHDGPNRAPSVSVIHAQLAPPNTFYRVNATDPDGDALAFSWSNTNSCGTTTGSGPNATWDHGDSTTCEHTGPIHDGHVALTITDAHGHSVSRCYPYGSRDGDGPPEGSALCAASAGVAEKSSFPWWILLLLLLVLLAIVLYLMNRKNEKKEREKPRPPTP